MGSIRSQAGWQVTSDVSNNTRPAAGGFSGFVETMATELLPISVGSNRSDGCWFSPSDAFNGISLSSDKSRGVATAMTLLSHYISLFH